MSRPAGRHAASRARGPARSQPMRDAAHGLRTRNLSTPEVRLARAFSGPLALTITHQAAPNTTVRLARAFSGLLALTITHQPVPDTEVRLARAFNGPLALTITALAAPNTTVRLAQAFNGPWH